jgi:hypothetical protein
MSFEEFLSQYLSVSPTEASFSTVADLGKALTRKLGRHCQQIVQPHPNATFLKVGNECCLFGKAKKRAPLAMFV